MPLNPRPDSEMERLCVRLFRSDTTELRKISEIQGIGFNQLIRQIIHSFVTQLNARSRTNLDQKSLSLHRASEINGMDEIILNASDTSESQTEDEGESSHA